MVISAARVASSRSLAAARAFEIQIAGEPAQAGIRVGAAAAIGWLTRARWRPSGSRWLFGGHAREPPAPDAQLRRASLGKGGDRREGQNDKRSLQPPAPD